MAETQFYLATLINLAINLIYTIAALVVGLAGLAVVDRTLLRSLRIEDELKKGNMAVAVFASTILIFVAVIKILMVASVRGRD